VMRERALEDDVGKKALRSAKPAETIVP